MEEIRVRVGLIKGRHEMPVNEYIFDEIEDVLDFNKMNETIYSFLENRVGISIVTSTGINQIDYSDVTCLKGNKKLIVYCTGLTAAVAQLIKLCMLNGISLSLMHYNRDNDDYVEQIIL